jgi:alpha-1,2-mannosyltransferase
VIRPTLYRVLLIGAWSLFGVLAVRFGLFAADSAPRESQGFINMYTAARLFREGAFIGQFYGDWFTEQMPRLGFVVGDIFFPNPPTSLLMALPLVDLDFTTARVIWSIVSLAALVVTLIALVRLTGLGGLWAPLFLSGVLVYQPLHTNVRYAQTYLLLLALLTLAWWGYRAGRSWALGLPLGVMLAFKVTGVWLLLLLLLQRQWKALLWVAGIGMAVVLLSLPWFGLETWRVYLSVLPQLRTDPSVVGTAFQSQPGFFRHLFTYDPVLSPAPLVNAPGFGDALAALSTIVLLVPSVWAASRYGRHDLVFAAFVIAGIVLVPVALDYHYTLMILPFAIILAALRDQPRVVPLLLFGVAAFAIGADLPYRSPQVFSGLWSFLAYPKLYGAWLLWGLTLFLLYRSAPVKITVLASPTAGPGARRAMGYESRGP